jgi:hypothetical protein
MYLSAELQQLMASYRVSTSTNNSNNKGHNKEKWISLSF